MEYTKAQDNAGREYLISNEGLYYTAGTPDGVIRCIDQAYRDRTRILLTQGDLKTGIPWGEEHDVEGYIGRSTGTIKIPLLIHNTRSRGGGGILTHCLLRIRKSKGGAILYQALNIRPLRITTERNHDHTIKVSVNGEIYAPHVNEATAKRLQRVLA